MHAFLLPDYPPPPPHADVLLIHPQPASISIDQVRQIAAFLSLKPLSRPCKQVFIYSAHTLTLPSQHAILKLLEEPPGASQIYLLTAQPNLLLPTILSRVQISTSTISPNFTKSAELLTQILALDLGHRLQLIGEQGFTRQSALEFMDHLEFILHDALCHPDRSGGIPLPHMSHLVSQTRKYLKSNVNLTLALDHFVLNLPL